MQTSSEVAQPVENTEVSGFLVSLGDVAELTLGDGGSGREDKRREYN